MSPEYFRSDRRDARRAAVAQTGHKFQTHITRFRPLYTRRRPTMPVPEHVYSAAVNGDLAVLREYFASGDRDPNDVVARNGWTLLDGACAGKRELEVISGPGHPVQTREQRVIKCEAISFLLSQGASVNYQSRGARPPRPRLRLGAGAPDGCPPPDPVRASLRHHSVAEPAPPRRLQARALVLAVEARLVVALFLRPPVRSSGIWLVVLVARAPRLSSSPVITPNYYAPPPRRRRRGRAHTHWSGSRSTTYFRAWMYMIGTPGIFLNLFLRSLSHVATMKHR